MGKGIEDKKLRIPNGLAIARTYLPLGSQFMDELPN